MTFPTKFSERMRAAMFPQQNLKRREAAFVRRDGVSHPRNAEMPSPFVEVRQIEFLARETPNYTLPRTCTHIPSMDMRERERFASRKRSDEGRTRSVAMIHRMTETEPQGFRQHNLSSTRTNVRFLSSLGRLVLSSMLDAKEQGAQRPEESTIIPFSNQGIDPLT